MPIPAYVARQLRDELNDSSLKVLMSFNSAIIQASLNKDAFKLDLALRAMYHYTHMGKLVDTTHMHFPEVEAIDKDFYILGKILNNDYIINNSLFIKKPL